MIHGLRLAAKREEELQRFAYTSEPRLTFDRFNRVPSDQRAEGALTPMTTLLLTITRDGISYRISWKQNNNELMIEESTDTNEWTTSASQVATSERFPMRIFSQGQIAELSGDNQQALLQIIDDAAGVGPLQEDLIEAQNSFFTTRTRMRELDGKLSQEPQLQFKLEDIERKLQRFESASHKDVLTTYRYRTRQSTEIDDRFASTEQFAECLENLEKEGPTDSPVDEYFDRASIEDQAARTILDSLDQVVQNTLKTLGESAQKLREQMANLKIGLGQSDWQVAVARAIDDYNKLVESLETVGVTDLNEYEKLVEQRQLHEDELKDLELVRQDRAQQNTAAEDNLQKVLEARRVIGETRENFLSTILDDNRFVRIKISLYGNDLLAVENSLRETLDIVNSRFQSDISGFEDQNDNSGIVGALLSNLPEDPVERRNSVEDRLSALKTRFEAACLGNGDFGGHFNNNLKRQFDQNPSFLDTLLTWFPNDGLSVDYSRTGDGEDFQPITQASAGQRAAAMLAFLLAHGEEPLILDQPENDLDNQLIYDLVVRQIRENKLKRQIIAVTHNPNIVVNGDSEMLHVLEFHKGQCVLAQSGSLQEGVIREKVCEVMEGGREAFERRYRRLGREANPTS